MKYLKVILNDGISEDFANSLRACYKSSIKSVEICDDEHIEIKKTEVGILDLNGLPDGYYINRKLDRFINGDFIDLMIYPELRGVCKDIKTRYDFTSIPIGALIEVYFVNHACRCGYFSINSQGDAVAHSSPNASSSTLLLNLTLCTDLKSIRIC